MNVELVNTINSIIANSTPLVIASIGETITERAGIINLSLDGSLALAAMAGFVAAYVSGSVWLGILAAMIVGALIALIVAIAGITLRQDQVAIGFVLTLLTADLAQFLGQDYTRIPGPTIPHFPIPLLSEIPALGPIFFRHDFFVYLSYILIFVTWFWLFRTRPGLAHRAVGERPPAAFARGTNVTLLRYGYALLGGSLVGLAGAAYSLGLKPGWQIPAAMRGDGWIALAIVIFGGWHPFRVVLGAYLFDVLKTLTSFVQRESQGAISPVVLNAIPWTLMILTLLLVSSGALERLLQVLPRAWQNRVRAFLRSDPPAALGTRFEAD